MKRICLVSLSVATVAASMALAVDDASAQRRGGVNRGGIGVNRVGVNRVGINRVGINRVGVNRVGIARAGVNGRVLAGNRVGWNGNWNNRYRPGWGVAAAGLAIGATAASAYNYGGYDSSYGSYAARDDDSYGDGYASNNGNYYPTRADYIRSYRYDRGYFGPICDPSVDSLCQ